MGNILTAAGTAGRKPSAIGTVAIKELIEILRDGRFLWTALIMVVLLATALATGWVRYDTQREMQEAAQGTSNHQFVKQGDKNPHSGAHYGNYAFKQAGPLSFFDNGVDTYTGSLLFMEAHKQNLALSPPAKDLSAVTRFGELNGAMILQVLMPLLVIFLGFTAFAGERERDTLRQLLSMGVSNRELLWGKAIGIGAAAALVVLPCILLGAAILAISGMEVDADAFWSRLGLLALCYGAYGMVFLFLTLGVSAMAPTARAALIVMVGFWAFSVFLVPKVAAEISKSVHPSPSWGEFDTSLARDRVRGLGGDTPRQRLAKYQEETLRQYGVTSTRDLPVYWTALRMQKLETMDHEVFDRYYDGLHQTYQSQRRVQDLFGILAPLQPLGSLSMGLAGTDLLHQHRFTSAAEQHRRMMVDRVNSYLGEVAASFNKVTKTGGMDNRVYVADEAFFATIPAFSYAPPSLAEVDREYRYDYLLIFGWLVAAILFAVGGVRRMRPSLH